MSTRKHPVQHSRQAQSFATHQTIVRMFGKHSIIVRLTGTVRMDQLNKKSRMYVSRKLGHHPTYHHFWFCTPEGVILTITGNKPELTALYEYFETESSPFYDHGETLFKGFGKVSYRRTLDKLLEEVIFPRGVRSFGGSIVENLDDYAEAILEAYQR